MNNNNEIIANFSFTIQDLKDSLERNGIKPSNINIKKFLNVYKPKHLEKPIDEYAHALMDDIIYDMVRLNILKG